MFNGKITCERNAQIVITLMKEYGVKKIVTSPGTMNVCLIASIQNDPFFEIYSAPEERSAAYMACGIAAESGEKVALTCTGATASRNYMPGLTEAYYRKLPILAITCSKKSMYIGHNIEQVTDRTLLPRDVARISVQANYVTDADTEWQCEIACNKAFLELSNKGGGPVHINLETMTSKEFVDNVKPVKVIKKYSKDSAFPEIKAKSVAVLIGSHVRWTSELTNVVDEFCEKYNGAVLCDQTSNYKGKYGIYHSLLMAQHNYIPKLSQVELAIYIGNVSAANFNISSIETWRVNDDGEIRDINKKVSSIFETSEYNFFNYYIKSENGASAMSYYKICKMEVDKVNALIPELPFSSFWIASKYANSFPDGSSVHYGIRNSQRAFSYFEAPKNIYCCSNTGGFGIDGCISSAIGASLVINEKLCFCILGDLAFFYDINSLGNRHINNNLRIILLNNGTGMELNFTDSFPGILGVDRDTYIAATGHYGHKSKDLVKHYASDLGYLYLSADSKESFDVCMKLMTSDSLDKSVICEVFIDKKDDDDAYYAITRLMSSRLENVKHELKGGLSKIVGTKGKKVIKDLLGE